MSKLKAYIELPCADIETISAGIYKHLLKETDLIGKPISNDQGSFWHFIDCKKLLADVPELLEFFKQNKLLPRHAAVTIIDDNDQLPKHVDEPPVLAKINLPVLHTKGWVNRWYEGNDLVAELYDMKLPVVFNSQIEHSVEKIDPEDLPRIVASFTFYNEPRDLLECE